MLALLACVEALERGQSGVVNRYARSVRREGNQPAMRAVSAVFRTVDRQWRGIGTIPGSGLALRPEYADFDAERKFAVGDIRAEEPTVCVSGKVLQGLIRPPECPAFGSACTPERPLGATMVSSEGACAAYYRYRLTRASAPTA
jgi:hydrogenase expression/formation protein HypD